MLLSLPEDQQVPSGVEWCLAVLQEFFFMSLIVLWLQFHHSETSPYEVPNAFFTMSY